MLPTPPKAKASSKVMKESVKFANSPNHTLGKTDPGSVTHPVNRSPFPHLTTEHGDQPILRRENGHHQRRRLDPNQARVYLKWTLTQIGNCLSSLLFTKQ